jgi:cyclopropane fatty-acyl-phospholipid synthase-like methyltransferase
MEVVDSMLEIAQVTEKDVVYDLGSGDGRIVIRAAKRFGARGVGVEIDPDLVDRSQSRAKQEGVEHLVEFRAEDGLTADLSSATVVTLYMLPDFNNRVRDHLMRALKPGARVVSHDFGIEGWSPQKSIQINGGILHDHTIHLWRITP